MRRLCFVVPTRYFYDSTKGLLLAEVYSDGTGLGYEYDSRNRLVLTLPVTYNETTNTTTKITNGEKAEYTYNTQGYLSKIETDSTTYSFTYDVFGNYDIMKAGNKVLANYEYNSNNGKLKSLLYGNGDKVEYVYDSLDRVSQICYTESGGTSETLYEYSYTNEGNLKCFKNHVDNTSTVYSYDGAGKIKQTVQHSNNSSGYKYAINYDYDYDYDIVASYSYVTDGVSKANYNGSLIFSRDKLGRLYLTEFDSKEHKGFYETEYDSFGRIQSRIITHTNQYTNEPYFYYKIDNTYWRTNTFWQGTVLCQISTHKIHKRIANSGDELLFKNMF